MDATTVVFAHTGGATANDIYGYYVTDGSGNLIYSERAAGAPFTISALGQTYNVSLVFKDKTYA